MMTSKTGRKLSSWRTLRILLPVVAVVTALVLSGVGLWLSNQQCGFCGYTDVIGVNSVTLGSNGWVTFNMSGAFSYNFVISTVKAYNVSSIYPYTPSLGSVSLSSNNVLPPKGKLILSIQFQGITWQPGVKYTLALRDSQGWGPNVYQCLNGC